MKPAERSHPARVAAGAARRAQRGMSLLETMVATIILSLGIAGVIGAHSRAFVGTDSAGFRTQAAWQASNLIERARANVAGVIAGSYQIGYGQATAGAGQVAADFTSWKAQLARALPAGDGSVTTTVINDPVTGMAVTNMKIVVRWDDRRASGEGATLGDPQYRYVYAETFLPAP